MPSVGPLEIIIGLVIVVAVVFLRWRHNRSGTRAPAWQCAAWAVVAAIGAYFVVGLLVMGFMDASAAGLVLLATMVGVGIVTYRSL